MSDERDRKRMAKASLMRFKAKTVYACWQIARREAQAYQRKINKTRSPEVHALCMIARHAADRIALKIRFGRVRHTSGEKKGR